MKTPPIRFTDLAKFQDKQKEAWYALLKPQNKYLLYGGAAYGGKSYFLRWAMIGLGMYYYAKYGLKNIPLGLFSEDYPSLKDRQVVRIKQEIPPFLGKLVDSRDEGYAFIAAPEYGSFIIYLRNLDDPSKYASVEFAAIGVEELTKNRESTFDDLRFRLRYPGIDEVKFFGATNPGSIGHSWVKNKWVKPDPAYPDPEQSRFIFIPARYEDNKYITDDYVLQLDSLPENKRKAFKEGSWDVFAGQYFDEWREDKHVITPFVPIKEGIIIIGGMDWGRTNPFAFYLSTVEKVFYEGKSFFRVKTFFETYGTNKKPSEWSTEIKEQLRKYKLTLSDISWVRADPSIFNKGNDGSKSIYDQFTESDERWRLLKPASNDRIPGWMILHDWLSMAPDGLPYWQQTATCTNFIRTFPSVVHDENIIEDVESSRRGGIDDDAADSVRYMLKHLKHIDAKTGKLMSKDEREAKQDQFFKDVKDTGKMITIDPSRFKR